MRVTLSANPNAKPVGLSVEEIGKIPGTYVSTNPVWRHLVFGVIGGDSECAPSFFFYNKDLTGIYCRTAEQMGRFGPFVKSDKALTIVLD